MSNTETVTLQYKMAKNDTYVYQITVDSEREIETGGNTQREQDSLKMKMTQKVLAVLPDGAYSLEMLVEPQSLVKNGQDVKIEPSTQKITMKMSKSGEILETSLPGPATQPSFPKHPVSVGQTWDGESQVTLQDPTTGQTLPPHTLKFLYTLTAIEKVKNYKCSHIKVKNPETEITLAQGIIQKIHAHGDTFFAHQEGRLVQSDVQTQISMSIPEGNLQNTIKIHVELTHTPEPAANEFLISG